MTTKRTSRSSLVFAGTFDEELLTGFEQPVKRVNSVFDAIGELATCSASDLVEAVIVDEQLLENDVDSSVDALRRVDPTTVIVVAGNSIKVKQADAMVPKDTTANRLTSAITNVQSLPVDNEIIPPLDIDCILGISDEITLTDDQTSLGDVDLVRALMHNPSTFKDKLIELLIQQTPQEPLLYQD